MRTTKLQQSYFGKMSRRYPRSEKEVFTHWLEAHEAQRLSGICWRDPGTSISMMDLLVPVCDVELAIYM